MAYSQQMAPMLQSQQRFLNTSGSSCLLQRKCACGSPTAAIGECDACRKKRLGLQRRCLGSAERHEDGLTLDGAPPIVHQVLDEPGQPLDSATRSFFEPRFGYDFGQVRVHADAKAAESARMVNAHAYTVGSDIVFAAGQYQPMTQMGQQLLAHELTHVVQQRRTGALMSSVSDLEAEAQSTAVTMFEAVRSRPVPLTSASGSMLLKSNGGAGTSTPVVQPVEPTDAQRKVIEDARRAAAIRTQIALMWVQGIVPPGRSDRYDPGEVMRRRARQLAQRMFQWNNPNMEQVEEVVRDMVSRLTNPRVMIAGRGDPECGTRAAYVRGLAPPIILCPTFFSDTPEQQIRTMIHEAAHLARIGNAGLGESYCVFFDCQTSCGGFDAADSWAHFVHCLSGQAPDQPPPIQGRSGSGGKP